MNYTTKDFSQIYPPEAKPLIDGWYPSTTNKERLRFFRKEPRIFVAWFFFKNGKWFANDNVSIPMLTQDLFWFGLNHNPKVK